MKNILLVLALALLVCLCAVGCTPSVQEIPPEGEYGYANPDGVKAEPDAGFVIDGVLDEQAYKDNNWLYLHNSDGGNNVSIAMTSYFGEKGMYFVYDVTESIPIYVNPDRATYMNSCIEMYLAPSWVTSNSGNSYFEIDLLPTGELSFKQTDGKYRYVKVATTADKMAQLGATTKGGPVNTEGCYGYNLELFIPWEYMEWLGQDSEAIKNGFVYINPAHISSFNYEGTDTTNDRLYYYYVQQHGASWSNIYQYFRFDGNGVLGTKPVTLTGDDHCTLSGDPVVIPGMMTTVTITPEAGYAVNSVTVNGKEMVEGVSFNAEGQAVLTIRGQTEGLNIAATTEAVTSGNKTLKGTVSVAKPGGDTLQGVVAYYSGHSGEKPITLDKNGNFEIADLPQGYYVIKLEKEGYQDLSRGIYLSRDMTVELALQYNTFQVAGGACWMLEDQNEGILRKFGGDGILLTTDSYNKFTFTSRFVYHKDLPKEGNTDAFTEQRSGMMIRFSNEKDWYINLLKQDGKYILQYAKFGNSVTGWKEICVLDKAQVAKYESDEGIKLTVQRDGQYAAVWLDDTLVAVEKLGSEYASCTAQLGFRFWTANRVAQDIPYSISRTNSVNLRNAAFKKEGKWDVTGMFQNYLTSPKGVGDTEWIWTYDGSYRDVTVHVSDKTPEKNNFKMAVHFKFGNGENFRIGLTNADTGALGTYKIQVLNGNTIAKDYKTHYTLNQAQIDKLTGQAGIDFRVAILGSNAIVYLDDVQVCAIDLSKDLAGGDTSIEKETAQIGLRLYGNETVSSKVSYKLGGSLKETSIQIEEGAQVTVVGETHVIGETIVLTPMDEGCQFVSVTVDGKEVQLTDLTRYTFTATAETHTVNAVSKRVYDWNPKENAGHKWDLTQQTAGILGKVADCADTGWMWTYENTYRDISLTVADKKSADNNFRVGIHFEFTDGNIFRVSLTNADDGALGTYKIQLMGANTIVKNWNTAYLLTPKQVEKLTTGEMTFRVVILHESVNMYLDGALAASYKLPGIADADAKIAVRYYGNSGAAQDVAYVLAGEPASVALDIAPVQNGTITPNATYYLPGDTATVTVKGDAGYAHDSFTVGGTPAMTDNNGVYSFVVQKQNTLNATFKASLFKSSVTGWALENQHYGKISVVQTNANGNSNWLDFTNEYGDVDITLVAREYEDAEKPELTRSAIRFMFGSKNITFSIAKNKGDKYSIQSLSGDNVVEANYDFYMMNEDQIEKFKSAEGIELRVIRKGTEVDIYLDGVQVVDAFDLTQNDSGITAGSKAKLTVRRYDDPKIEAEYTLRISGEVPKMTVIDKVTMTEGTITPDMKTYLVGEEVTVTVTANTGYAIDTVTVNGKTEKLPADGKVTFVAQEENTLTASFRTIVFGAGGDWDISQQESGLLKIANSDGDSGWVETNRKDYQNVDVRVTIRDQKTSDANFRVGIRIYFKNDKYVTFSITNDRVDDDAANIYELQTMGGTILNWKDLGYDLTEAQVAALTGEQGLQFRVVRVNTIAHVYLGGVHIYEYDMGSDAKDQLARVVIRHYGNSGKAVTMPFSISEDVEGASLTVTAGENGTVTAKRKYYLVGETVELTVAGNAGYAHDSFKVNGADQVTDNYGKYSFIAAKENTVSATFAASLFKSTVSGWLLENQHYGQIAANMGSGHSGWADMAGEYGDFDITLTTKEFEKTNVLARTLVRLMFVNGKTMTISLAKNKEGTGYKYTIQSIGANNLEAADYDYYRLSDAQVAKFTGDGIKFRVVRNGTRVCVYLDDELVVDGYDLTKNNSGITADTKMTVTVRQYDTPNTVAVFSDFQVSSQMEKVTLNVSAGANGTVTTDQGSYLPGQKVTVTVAGDAGYAHDSFKVNGADQVTDNYGKFSFIAAKENTVSATFKASLFKSTVTGWLLENQHYGKIVVNYNNANGNSNWLDFANEYGDVDITLVAREYADTSKPDLTRSAIRFMFGSKNITFSIAKNKDGTGHKYSVQSLAGDNIVAANYDFYVMNQAQIDKFKSEEGIALRVVRQGTKVDIYLDGVLVAENIDLTQNNSGVTADSKANLTIRRYDDPGIKAEYGITVS